VDTEAAMEALLNHVGRLVRNESTSIADCRTHIRGLQRKLKSTKELLDSRVSVICYIKCHNDDDGDDNVTVCIVMSPSVNLNISIKVTLLSGWIVHCSYAHKEYSMQPCLTEDLCVDYDKLSCFTGHQTMFCTRPSPSIMI